jgi:hypothetical protein
MKNFTALFIVVALIPGISYAADAGSSEALITAIEKKLDEIKTGRIQNYRLVEGVPDPFVDALIAEAQHNAAAANGNGMTLLEAIESALLSQPAPQPSGATSTCVDNRVAANMGVYSSGRDCSAGFMASQAWMQANMYNSGNYILQASWGNIDFGHSAAGQPFVVHYSPSGVVREFVWLINATN